MAWLGRPGRHDLTAVEDRPADRGERDRARHPFERPEVVDQGSPDGRGTVDDPGRADPGDDPADPAAPVHPER